MIRILGLFAITLLVALTIGIMIFIFGEKSSRKHTLVVMAIFLILCLGCLFSIFQTNETNTGCIPLPEGFSESDLFGTWVAGSPVYPTSSDTLIIRDNGTYKQIIKLEFQSIEYESDWQAWWFEYRDNGTGYLHLDDYRICAATTEDSCDWINDGNMPYADVCDGQWMDPYPLPGEIILVVRGVPESSAENRSHPLVLTLFKGFESSPWSYHFEMP